jgi:hypothetical protein
MKSSPVMLTAALVLCLSGSGPGPGRGGVAGSAPARQRHADHARLAGPALARQRHADPEHRGGSRGVLGRHAARGGGLSTFLIALISFGRAVALAGAAYGARRLSHAHAGPPMA